jgi:hypothetical protein
MTEIGTLPRSSIELKFRYLVADFHAHENKRSCALAAEGPITSFILTQCSRRKDCCELPIVEHHPVFLVVTVAESL